MTILTEDTALQEDNVPAIIGTLLAEMAASPAEYPVELMTEAFGAAAFFVAGGNPLEEASDLAAIILDEGMVERLQKMAQAAGEMVDKMKDKTGPMFKKAQERARAAKDAAADAARKAGARVSAAAKRTGKAASVLKGRARDARQAWKDYGKGPVAWG